MLDLISLLVVILVSTSLGLFIYHNNPKSATNRLYTLLSATIIFWAIIMYLSLQPQAPNQRLLIIRWSMLAATLMTTAALLLSHTIPHDKLRLSKRYLALILGIAALTMATAISPYMFTDIVIEGNNIEPTPGPGILLFLIPGIGYSLLSVGILIKKYFKAKGRVKNQLRFVLLGLAVMFTLLVFTNFILVVVFKISSLISLGPLFTLTFLSSTAYAITRHRLLEIRFLVARAVAFTLVSTAIMSIFAISLLSLPRYLSYEYANISSVILALFLAYSFTPLQRIIAQYTEKVFHRNAYSSEALLEEISEITRSTLSIKSLTTDVLEQMGTTLRPTKSAFILIKDKHISIDHDNFDTGLEISIKEIKYLAKEAKKSLIVLEETDKRKTKKLLRAKEFSVVVPLVASKKTLGVFVLGAKSSGETYNNQDLNVLEIVGPQLSIAIQNSLAFDEIKHFNITLREKIKEATKDLRKANRELRHLDKLKDEFVYIATHELKTPVTVIKGYISMIDAGSFGEISKPLKEAFNEISAANHQLTVLVTDLLQIARSEANALTVDTKPVNLCDVVDHAVSNTMPLVKQKKLNVNYSCTKSKMVVMADEDRLTEIINNLLSNAIKYSDKGTIKIDNVVDGKFLITHISDQGHGMSPEDQKKVFTRFFRAETLASKVPGTGLGLFIVKQLVEKMGGKIWFSSELEKGTTFSFSLPLATEKDLQKAEKEAQKNQA